MENPTGAPPHDDQDEDFPSDLPTDPAAGEMPPELAAATAKDLGELGRQLLQVDEQIEELDKKRAGLEERWGFISRRMVELMETVGERGMRNFTLEGVARFQMDPKLQVSVLKADRDKLLGWLKGDSNTAPLVRETVQPNTLKGFVKELIKRNETIPDFIKVHKYTEIKAVGVKPKAGA